MDRKDELYLDESGELRLDRGGELCLDESGELYLGDVVRRLLAVAQDRSLARGKLELALFEPTRGKKQRSGRNRNKVRYFWIVSYG